MSKIENILVIDDNHFLRSDLAEILTLEGYTVFTAEDGEVGLQRLSDNNIDLVICDYNMPKLNGEQVLTKIRTTESTRDLPFILISATMLSSVNTTHAHIFLRKPVILETLLTTINDIAHPNQ
jgi:CheY-like chemotaxis protein